MTDDDILAAARKAYREDGIKPITGAWHNIIDGTHCACITSVAGKRGKSFAVGRAEVAIRLERTLWWVDGLISAWDGGLPESPGIEEYVAGYAFGLRCREEFKDLLETASV